MAEADLVLYDSLANPRLLDLARSEVPKRLVGKRHGKTSVAQADIEREMIAAARRGMTVVRLKGGDPFIFGRGGEEAQACRAAGIEYEVVPGITSAIAAPAYCGIPLTHRDHASAVAFVTVRAGDDQHAPEPAWDALAHLDATLVFLMGMLEVERIARELCRAGMDPATPAAAVRWGTLAQQRSVVAPLGELAQRVRALDLRPPGVVVVGAVAALADELAWYERKPLFGRRIVVTRARSQAHELADLLERHGAGVIECPVIEIAPPDQPELVAGVQSRIGSYDWLVLTSTNGVDRFFETLLAGGHDLRELAGVRIAAIGPATAAAVERRGLRVEVVPREYRAEALLESLGEVAGLRVLLARAAVARDVLPDTLRTRGADVEVVAVYKTVDGPGCAPATLADADVVTFTSSSTVERFLRLAGEDGRALLARSVIAAIGPVTADTLRKAGFEAGIVPGEYTIAALGAAIVDYFANRQAPA
jgi:uroporphyrinogen III methyltransferase/synthase